MYYTVLYVSMCVCLSVSERDLKRKKMRDKNEGKKQIYIRQIERNTRRWKKSKWMKIDMEDNEIIKTVKMSVNTDHKKSHNNNRPENSSDNKSSICYCSSH